MLPIAVGCAGTHVKRLSQNGVYVCVCCVCDYVRLLVVRARLIMMCVHNWSYFQRNVVCERVNLAKRNRWVIPIDTKCVSVCMYDYHIAIAI